jgi:hypothetical protein
MSNFFENIFKDLITNAFRPGAYNKDYNLTMYCFLLIGTLIEYSSHDKQDRLKEILKFFLTQLEITFDENTINSSPLALIAGNSGITREIIQQMQSFYCNIFRALFRKMLKVLSPEEGTFIYNFLEKSFKIRQGVYDEAIVCIGSLAHNMDESFKAILPSFSEYLIYALNKFEESSLNKSAIITLGHIVRAVKFEFHKYSNKIIPILINIMVDENVSRYNKLVVISTLGEICMYINEHFLPYLEQVMQLLFSACELATTHADIVRYFFINFLG